VELEKLVKKRGALARLVTAGPRGQAADLYLKTIAELEKELYLSPDGALNLVPFGALPDAEGRNLLERHRIS